MYRHVCATASICVIFLSACGDDEPSPNITTTAECGDDSVTTTEPRVVDGWWENRVSSGRGCANPDDPQTTCTIDADCYGDFCGAAVCVDGLCERTPLNQGDWCLPDHAEGYIGECHGCACLVSTEE